MAVIQANRESIDDRFSVLGFTIRSDDPLFEIGVAAHPDLLKAENRGKRTPHNFFSSRVLRATQRRGESVYLVPPDVVAQFVGQPRLYFGIATYKEGDPAHPASVKFPETGNMYVNLSGLTERGLRRTARGRGGIAYGNGGGSGLTWGGDAVAAAPAPAQGNGGRAAAAAPPAATPAPYSDGYSDDLWKQSPAPSSSTAAPAATSPAASTPTATAAQPGPATTQGLRGRQPLAKPFLVGAYDNPSSWWDALTTQIAHFARGAAWFLGVTDTTKPPYSAICQVRRPDGTEEGAHHASAFFIAPRLLLTAAHVVDGQTELIIVPGKNGGGVSGATEPFGRFRVTQFAKHPQYGVNGSDNDMALICVPAANAAAAPNYFDLVEELTQSRPEGVVVSGYAAWWYATSAIEEFVNNNIDENRQHANGGYIRELPTDGTFTYDLQTLGGTSGSPVYWIENGAAPRAHMVGVHVAANDDRTNKGCRITQEKLAWIRQTAAGWSQTLTFSMSVRALETPAQADDDPDAYGICADEPVEVASTAQAYRARALGSPQPDYPGASRFAPAATGNFRVGRRAGTTVDRIVIHITAGGPSINGTISWFQNPDAKVSSHYIVGRDGEVVQMVRNADTAYHASQVNSRSIGIEHNANKPTRSNPRDLPPTEPQYEASARLVAWLCRQYGLPIDREHIVGHNEASPRDNHDCPTSYWDWDHYIACVQAAAAQPASAPATAQGVRRAAPVVRGLEIITPFYDPADTASALTCQADAFSQAREEWFAGVPNTAIFPHSAICLLEMRDASGSLARGTGFYIGRNRILTCGHNLYGMASVDIVPAKNGNGGAATEPYGRCTVQSSSWRIPASYGGSNPATDLAVIENVPIEAPNGQWFDALEELNQSRPEGVVVCGYSSRSVRVPELTAAIDGFRQHLHAGYIAALGPGDSTFDYPILTLKRASGSPVYYVSNKDGFPRAYVVGVHTGNATEDLNRGCRLTTAKIDWIEGRATSLAARGLEAVVDDDNTRGVEGPIPDDTARAQGLGARALTTPSPEYPQASRFVPADPGNYRAVTGGRTIERVVIHITDGGANINGTIGWFQNPTAKVSAHYVIGQDGEVVQMVRHNDVAWHARSANSTSIGIEHVANTRGLRPTPAQMCASAALVTYLCDTFGIPVDRAHILGHSEADPHTSHTGCPNAVWDWDYYMRLVTSRTCFEPDAAPAPTAQGLRARAQSAAPVPGRTARALSNDNPDYVVSLIPQPDKNSCWCASMAMLLSYRRQQSFTAESVANEVGASLATCYTWDLLNAVRDRYGFTVIPQPSNASIYNTPQQWADWLNAYGPLWVVIVGAPHAVVLAGIRGNLADPNSVRVHIFNPWDTRVAFDTDPVTFNPPNYGYEDWLPFTQFASDFGNMAEPDYGNWRILYLPASAAASQSLGARRLGLAAPPPPIRALGAGEPGTGETREPVEPTRVPGTRMFVARGAAGACRWALDQLEGYKEPASAGASVSSAADSSDVTIELRDWPAIENEASPLPITISFKATRRGAVGDVQIRAGTPANLAYGVEVSARIDDDRDVGSAAAIKVGIDYRFSGLAQGDPAARIDLRLLGDGRYERVNRWVGAAQAA